MAEQIKFFEKNQADFADDDVVATASQGSEFAELALNRLNTSGWATTGSVDADNTTWEVDFGYEKVVDHILLIGINFKNYTIKKWNGSAYEDFAVAIAVTNNTAENKEHVLSAPTTTQKIKVTITGTMTANDDKFMAQFIATNLIGQFNSWPEIKKPLISRNRQISTMISGKKSVREQVGFFSCQLECRIMSDSDDLTLIENLYSATEGFLVWICGGNESQFRSVRMGYRMKDIYLMKCADELSPEWYKGLYKSGMKVQMDLVEVVS